MLTVKQAIARRRKYGAFRFALVIELDQHDSAKVNSAI
jgi:hypothetical protein